MRSTGQLGATEAASHCLSLMSEDGPTRPSPQLPPGPALLLVPCHTCFSLCVPHPQLLRTSEDVTKMQEELEIMRPLLEEAAKDTLLTMEQIKVGYPWSVPGVSLFLRMLSIPMQPQDP